MDELTERRSQQAGARDPWHLRPGTLGYRVLDRLSMWSRRPILSPFARSVLRDHLKDDDEENQKSTPPADQSLQLHGIWAFEAYTPSNIDALLRQMTRRGWEAEFEIGSERNLVRSLREMRRAGSRGVQHTYFYRHTDRRIGRIGHQAILPDFAETAIADIYFITPSITCLSIFFVAKLSERKRFDDAVRRSYVTTVEHKGRSVSAVTPEWAKKKAVNALRADWRHEVGRWLRTHMPGHFSKSGQDCKLITCELVVEDGITLFEKREADKPLPLYSDLAGARFALYSRRLTGGSLGDPKSVAAQAGISLSSDADSPRTLTNT